MSALQRSMLRNNNNNFRVGRPASSSMGSPYSRPAIAGKPGIRLAPSCPGFSRSPLPALCRQATSCAWRSRLRILPDEISGCSGRRVAARSRLHLWALLAVQTVARRNRLSVHGRPWAASGQRPWPKSPKRLSKRPTGIERRRAPNVTCNAVWRTCVPESI